VSDSPLQYPDFNKVWLGNFVSRIGSEMTFGVAIPFQVYLLSNKDPNALGLIGLARGVPIILMALAGGAIADAFDRRKLLMVTQLVFFALSALLAVAAWQGFTSLPLLYGVTAAGGVLVAVDLPARQALLPNLVPPPAFPRAVSLNATLFQLAAVVGPALGGLVLGQFGERGPEWIYRIDATTFLVLFLAIAWVDYRPLAKPPAPSIRAVFDGVRFVWAQPTLWSTMTLDFLATFFAGAMFLMPIFALDILGGSKRDMGYLMAAPAVGAAVTALVMSFRSAPRWQGAAILGGVAIYGVTSAAMGCATVVWFAFLMLALSGAGDAVSMVVRNTLRQELTPDALRARMVSFNMIFFVGGPLLGEYEAGLVAKYWDVRTSIVSGGIACVLCALIYIVRYPWLWRYERVATPKPLVASS
jgi:MFS family permease